ncbi:Hsp20/alpha crystallin family protein [Streptomyces sp. HD1123-B1]|uniref:Hsp20/alpha crystallin family protein n=1 Tax=Streptomyces huangiella TaxID=3228804 RepID=UPI003D7CFEDE
MTLPAHHRRGRLSERPFPGLGWDRPVAAEFDDLFDRMNQFLEAAGGVTPTVGAWAPMADLRETDDAYVVEAELPGVKRENIDLEVTHRQLSITGEYKEREREGALRRSTRRTGSFEYHAMLPADVRAEDITATLTEGVLTVTVPKAQKAKPRHIEIT